MLNPGHGCRAALTVLTLMLAACRAPGEGARAPITLSHDTASPHALEVLIVTDLHFNPFDDRGAVDALARAPVGKWPAILNRQRAQPFSTYGHDSNAPLILSAFAAMKRAVPHPAFVLQAGDLFAHDFHNKFLASATDTDDASYNRFVDKTADYLAASLHALYPGVALLPTIGNNDGYCGDYDSTPHDAYLAHQAATWVPLMNAGSQTAAVTRSFKQGGYYATTIDGLRVISLNTVFMTSSYSNPCGDPGEHPGLAEIAWFNRQFTAEPQPPTLVLTHVPPGIDGFKTFFHLGFPVALYDETLTGPLLAALNAPAHHVTAIVTGHLHDTSYRQTDAGNADDRPIITAPAVSPIFGNTPAFAVLTVSTAGRVDDMQILRLESAGAHAPVWHQAVDFDSRYGENGLTAQTFENLHMREVADSRLRRLVQRDSVGYAPALAVTTFDARTLLCTEVAMTKEAFLRCEGAVTATPAAPVPSR